MLKETYLANLARIPTEAKRIMVARPSILAPSKSLLADWKTKKITWSEYEVRYKRQILSNPEAVKYMRAIKELANKVDVYLYCYEKKPPCHRFILIDLIQGG
ncbi:hypothetical protein ES703_91861 [subsurface metagenome]